MCVIEQADALENRSKQLDDVIEEALHIVAECGTSINDYLQASNIVGMHCPNKVGVHL